MTLSYAEASDHLKSEYGLDLLECLEQCKANVENDIPMTPRTLVAYYTLMAGFTAMFA